MRSRRYDEQSIVEMKGCVGHNQVDGVQNHAQVHGDKKTKGRKSSDQCGHFKISAKNDADEGTRTHDEKGLSGDVGRCVEREMWTGRRIERKYSLCEEALASMVTRGTRGLTFNCCHHYTQKRSIRGVREA